MPQPSLAVNFRVFDLIHVPVSASLAVTVGDPHASVAFAVPNPASIALDAGLHPNVVFANVQVNVGAVLSSVHVIVLQAVDVLPQASRAVNVLFWERVHPLLDTLPSLGVITVGMLHASVAVAVPRAALISLAEGLHPNDVVVPPVVKVGPLLSSVHVTVLHVVAVFPQPSMAVNVLFCERLQLLD